MNDQPTVGRAAQLWALALMSIAGFMTALDALVVATALPAIQRDLGAGVDTLSWTVNAFELALAAGIITAAALGDRLGRRRVFVAGLALFTLASAACALAPTPGLLIAARTLQGVGASIVSPLSLTILAASFPARRRGAVVGIWGGVAGLAIAGGPLVGGALTQSLSWHWVFWANVPVGVGVCLLALSRLPESRGATTRLDLPALVLVSAGACAISWGLIRAGASGWARPEILGSLLFGLLLLGAFVAWEARAEQPMLPLRLFRSRSFAAANASGFLMLAALIPAAFLISQFLQFGLGYSPLVAGLSFLPMTATPLVVAPVAGLLSDRFGPRPLMLAGMVLFAAGLGWLAALAQGAAGYGELALPLLIAGIGVSMPFGTAATAALGAVPPADLGKASGVANTLRNFGGAFGIAVSSAVFAAHGHLGTPATFNAGFRPALAVAAGIAFLGALAAAGVSGGRRSPATLPERQVAAPANR